MVLSSPTRMTDALKQPSPFDSVALQEAVLFKRGKRLYDANLVDDLLVGVRDSYQSVSQDLSAGSTCFTRTSQAPRDTAHAPSWACSGGITTPGAGASSSTAWTSGT